MKDIEHERIVIRQYLLGELAEPEQEQLEQRVITDPDYKEEVLITEEELLEEYVNGTLSPRELELFTKVYSSSPARRRKVKIAQALNKYAAKQAVVVQPMDAKRRSSKSLFDLFSAKTRFHQFSIAALIVVAVGGAILTYWLITHEWRANYNTLLALNQAGSEILQPNGSVVSVSLPPLLFRGAGERKNINVTKETETIQLRLPDPSGGTSAFRAVLKHSDGSEVFTLDDLRARQIDQHSVLVLQIPVTMLKPPPDYQLEISEKRPDGTYENVAAYPLHLAEAP
ncbi:MAG TPA: hypothetical protein VJT15_05915 [Pyrinomonadaceae bacterium]|nr:hypothetical protein [Pyrinomonadaceae bacterium]